MTDMGNQHSAAERAGERQGGRASEDAVLKVRACAPALRDGSGHVVDASADDEVTVALASTPFFAPLRDRGASLEETEPLYGVPRAVPGAGTPARAAARAAETEVVVLARFDATAVLRLLAAWQAHAGRCASRAAAQQDALAARVLACDERAGAVLAQQQTHAALVARAVAALARVPAMRRETRSVGVRAEYARAAAQRVEHALAAVEQRLRTWH